MSEAFERAYESLQFGENQITEEDYQEQLRKVQEDMSEGLREAVEWGIMTQDEADQYEYDWMQRYGR